MQIKELIGMRIKHLREARNQTQESLAEKLNISPKYLSSIERGKENPTLDVLIKLSTALRVDVGELFLISHEESDPKKLRKLANRLLRETDEDRLRLAVKILLGILH